MNFWRVSRTLRLPAQFTNRLHPSSRLRRCSAFRRGPRPWSSSDRRQHHLLVATHRRGMRPWRRPDRSSRACSPASRLQQHLCRAASRLWLRRRPLCLQRAHSPRDRSGIRITRLGPHSGLRVRTRRRPRRRRRPTRRTPTWMRGPFRLRPFRLVSHLAIRIRLRHLAIRIPHRPLPRSPAAGAKAVRPGKPARARVGMTTRLATRPLPCAAKQLRGHRHLLLPHRPVGVPPIGGTVAVVVLARPWPIVARAYASEVPPFRSPLATSCAGM